jgi:phospholipid-binding lipoprotein MlaA
LSVFSNTPARLRVTAAALGIALLGACASSTAPLGGADAAFDPYEAQNRKTFAANQKLTNRGSGGVTTVVPGEIQDVIHNFSENLSMPQVAVNSLLQGDLRGTGLALHRFAVNSVLGIGGLVDAASEFGVPEHDTDFGETLHAWGVGEGAFVMLPILGPSTQRDVAGRVVDLFTDPLSYRLPEPERYVGTAVGLVDGVLQSGKRVKPATYEAARAEYLARRRAEVSSRRH